MIKKCNQCKKTKPFSEYYRSNRGDIDKAGGYRYICKPCDNKKSNARRKKDDYKAEKRRQKAGSKHAKKTKINSQKHRTEMSSMYIRSLITKKSKGLDPKDIPDELVQLHRAALKIKRKLLENSE
jgi:hypothetical protein